jgi:hypothetical protein
MSEDFFEMMAAHYAAGVFDDDDMDRMGLDPFMVGVMGGMPELGLMSMFGGGGRGRGRGGRGGRGSRGGSSTEAAAVSSSGRGGSGGRGRGATPTAATGTRDATQSGAKPVVLCDLFCFYKDSGPDAAKFSLGRAHFQPKDVDADSFLATVKKASPTDVPYAMLFPMYEHPSAPGLRKLLRTTSTAAACSAFAAMRISTRSAL